MAVKLEKIRVFIADVNAETRESLANELESDAITVVGTAPDGISALKQIESLKPDVVIMDIVMPGLDGLGVLKRLNEEDERPEVIMLTALTQEEFVRRAIELGAKYYMAKPCEPAVVKGRILDIIGLERLEQKEISGLDMQISKIFMTIGIPAHIKGYYFLREAIKMVTDKPDTINRITKELYPTIAQKYRTSASKVERAMRHAIEVAWSRGRLDNLDEIVGCKVYDPLNKPTNGEFIALIADKLKLEKDERLRQRLNQAV